MAASVSLVLPPAKGEGLPARSLLDSELGVASTWACGYQGPCALGQGLEGMQACAHRPGGQTISATVHKGPPRPPRQAFPGGSEAGCPLSLPRPVTYRPAFAHLGLWGSRPGLPGHSAPPHRPSSNSTSRVPQHARAATWHWVWERSQSNTWMTGVHTGRPCHAPLGWTMSLLASVSPLVTGHCWTSRTGRHPFTPRLQAGHRRTVAAPPSCPGVLPETHLRVPW